MKHTILFIAGILSLLNVMAQDPAPLPSLNSIRTPNSPAFSVLGVQPTSIERPNTPADFTAAIDNATDGFTKFPQNFAIEFSPYWMSQQPRALTWENDKVRTVDESLARTFSASLATISKEVNKKDVKGLSYGLRAFVLSGTTSAKSVEAIKALEDRLKSFSERYTEMAQARESDLRSEYFEKLREATNDDEKKLANEWYADQRKEIAADKQEWIDEEEKKTDDLKQDFAPQREGLIVELAYAAAYRNDTVSTEFKKNGYAFWVTPSYVRDNYSVVGVYRYLKDSLDNKSREYGVRFIYSQDRYAISAEYLKGEYERETVLPNRERFSVLFEYLVNEKIWLTLSFGEDNKNIQNTQSIFSSLGIRYNFSRDRYSFE